MERNFLKPYSISALEWMRRYVSVNIATRRFISAMCTKSMYSISITIAVGLLMRYGSMYPNMPAEAGRFNPMRRGGGGRQEEGRGERIARKGGMAREFDRGWLAPIGDRRRAVVREDVLGEGVHARAAEAKEGDRLPF